MGYFTFFKRSLLSIIMCVEARVLAVISFFSAYIYTSQIANIGFVIFLGVCFVQHIVKQTG